MNLEEVKKRAIQIKAFSNEGEHDRIWAADTILQLVAEVEKLRQEGLNQYQYSKAYHGMSIDKTKRIEKLTAANKIMRDKLVDVKSQLDAFKCDACSTAFSTVSIDNTIAEVDEVLK